MNKLEKYLRKLPLSEKKRAREAIARILVQDFVALDIKLLKGHKGLFRARVGDLRIIYRLTNDGVELVDISHRSEKTYKDL